MKTSLFFLSIILFIISCSKKDNGNPVSLNTYVATISSIDQQEIKGWGCCPVWIGNHDFSTQPLTQMATNEMGAGIIICQNNQPIMRK